MALPISRTEPSAFLRETPIIAVLRAKNATDYGPVVTVLVESGIRSIELTMSTPGTLEVLPELLATVGSSAEIGVGTITSVEQATEALDNGAAYLVTPIVDTDVIALAVGRGVPVYPGGLTPTELHTAWRAGASAVKIFPAKTVGAEYGKHLRGPFPDLRFVPSGGVTLLRANAWLQAGASAVSIGGPLIGDALAGGSLTALAQRATDAVALLGRRSDRP